MSVRLLGVDWELDFWFFAAIALFLLLDRSGLALPVLAAAALHEAGHLVVMRACGVRAEWVRLSLDGVALRAAEGSPAWSRPAILCAGSLTNFIAAAALALYGAAAMAASACQCAVGLFNLLPLEGLDGGLLLCGALCRRHGADLGLRVFARAQRLLLALLVAATAALAALYGLTPWLCVGAGLAFARTLRR